MSDMDQDLSPGEKKLRADSFTVLDLVLERVYPGQTVGSRRKNFWSHASTMMIDTDFAFTVVSGFDHHDPVEKISFLLMYNNSDHVAKVRSVVDAWSTDVVTEIRAGQRNLAFFIGAMLRPLEHRERGNNTRIGANHLRFLWHDVNGESNKFQAILVASFLEVLGGNAGVVKGDDRAVLRDDCKVGRACHWRVSAFNKRLCVFPDCDTLAKKSQELITVRAKAQKAVVAQLAAVQKQKTVLQQGQLQAEDALDNAETVSQGTSYVNGPSMTLGGREQIGKDVEEMFFAHFRTLEPARREEVLKRLREMNPTSFRKVARPNDSRRALKELAPVCEAQLAKEKKSIEDANLRVQQFREAFQPFKDAIKRADLVLFGGLVPTLIRHTGCNLYLKADVCALLMEYLCDLGLCYWFLADFVREFHSVCKLTLREYPVILRLSAFAARLGPDGPYFMRYLCQAKLNTLDFYDVVGNKHVTVMEMLGLLGVSESFRVRFKARIDGLVSMNYPSNLAPRLALNEMRALHWPLLALYAGRMIKNAAKCATLANLDRNHEWFYFNSRCDSRTYIKRVLGLLYEIRQSSGGLRIIESRWGGMDAKLALSMEMIAPDVAEVRYCPSAKDVLSWLLGVARTCHDLHPEVVVKRCSESPGMDADGQPMPRIPGCVDEDGHGFVGTLSDSILEGAGGDPAHCDPGDGAQDLVLSDLPAREEEVGDED